MPNMTTELRLISKLASLLELARDGTLADSDRREIDNALAEAADMEDAALR